MARAPSIRAHVCWRRAAPAVPCGRRAGWWPSWSTVTATASRPGPRGHRDTAMSDDTTTLRLVAELKDDVTGRLAAIQKALKATGDAGKTVHTSGAAQAKEHARAYKEL